jgi:hypothetical protein
MISNPTAPVIMPRGEECNVIRDVRPLGCNEARDRGVERAPDAEPSELVGKAARLDHPEGAEELDERDAGQIRCTEEISRGRACPRRSGRIEQRREVAGSRPSLR